MRSFQEIKGHLGHIVNLKTEPLWGAHVSLQRSFPFVKVSRLLRERFLTVRMDVINRCNLHCKMCYFSLDEVRSKPRVEMSELVFERIAHDVFPVATQLILSAGAEPLCAAHFPEMLELAGKYQIPHIAFFTNGMLLNEQNIPRIVRAGVNVMTVSFDGATAATFEAIRRGARFGTVVDHIRLLQKTKAELGVTAPDIHFGVVLMRSNIRELPDILRLAKELGVAKVTASHLVPYQELRTAEESLTHEPELANEFLDKARATAQELGMAFDAPPNFPPRGQTEARPAAPPARLECYWPWRELLIRPDGTTHPCCYWYEDTSMGDFASQRFSAIWFGAKYRRLREELTTGAYRETCAKCPGMNPISQRADASQEVQIVGS